MSQDLYSQQVRQNMISGQFIGQRERIEVKDPTISDAQDAIAALRKRREEIASELKRWEERKPRIEAEAARIDRMLAAAAPVEP